MKKTIDFTKYHHCVSTMPLFQGLIVEDIQSIQNYITEKNVSAGKLVYAAGEKLQSLYLIQEGQLKVYRLAASGKQQMIRILQQGDFVGEMSLFEERHYDYYIEATQPSKLCAIKKDDFEQVLLAHPQIAIELLGEMARRLDDAEQQTTGITTSSTKARLIQYLLHMSEKQDSLKVKLATTKKATASYLGMSPETFSRCLSKLTKDQLISQPHPNIIEILDKNALEFALLDESIEANE